VVPPYLKHASRHASTHAVTDEPHLQVTVRIPVSFSLTLSGGFNMAPSADLHPLGSLLDSANIY